MVLVMQSTKASALLARLWDEDKLEQFVEAANSLPHSLPQTQNAIMAPLYICQQSRGICLILFAHCAHNRYTTPMLNACIPLLMPLVPMYACTSMLESPQSLTKTSKHGTLHSLVPSRLLSHPNPMPVHSVLGILRPKTSKATPAKAEAVSLTAFVKNEAFPLHVCVLSDPVA